MDQALNPYTPHAGASPPALIGRGAELEAFDLLLRRLANGYTEQSLIVVGLRGVGKTVLLREFRQIALTQKWQVIDIEVSKRDDNQFRKDLALEARRALYGFAPRKKWTEKTIRAASLLKSFSLSIDPEGKFTIGIDREPLEGYADSGYLKYDLRDLLVGLGEAAKDKKTGVMLLIDEFHFLPFSKMEALIEALHKTVQENLPIVIAAAGLPQIHELVGEARTYAERLFKFSEIGTFERSESASVLREPAEKLGVSYSEAAADHAFAFTKGYPFFLQEFGRASWDLSKGPEITGEDAVVAQAKVEEKLDSGFFKVRLERTTELQRAYLRAMAELGPEPQLAKEVASLLNRTSVQCGAIRKQLIDKGLLYATEHGYAAFTVPQFDRYLKRAIPELIDVPVRRHRCDCPAV